MRYVLIDLEISTTQSPNATVRYVTSFPRLREAKAAAKEWQEYQKSHGRGSWSFPKLSIYDQQNGVLIDEYFGPR